MRSSNVGRTARRLASAAALLAAGLPAALGAQTDYYNTDAGRPTRIEDAYAVERYAFELQVAPVRLERTDHGGYHWEFEPEIAFGVLPRTQVEVGLPITLRDDDERTGRLGIAGVHVSALHNLNIETRTLPAFAVAAELALPGGTFGPDRVYPSVKGIATRSFDFGRVHLNGRYTIAPEPGLEVETGEASRWMAGIAVDRAIPLRSILLIADVFAERALHAGEPLEWTAEAGGRLQLSPHFALDAGVGRRLTGDEQAWFATFGAARAFGVRSLMPR